jgi:hypothetical protein
MGLWSSGYDSALTFPQGISEALIPGSSPGGPTIFILFSEAIPGRERATNVTK